MPATSAPRSLVGRFPLWFLQAVVAVMLALKLAAVLSIGMISDEPYYFLWGQHLDWSYFDHPPLNAWLLFLSEKLFGWSWFAMRAPTLFSIAGTAWIFWLWSGHATAPENRVHWFWLVLAVYVATPGVAIFTSIVFPDYLLLFLLTVSGYFFSRYLSAIGSGAKPGRHLVYLAAAALGLACLGKFNAALFGFAVALLILLHPRYRPALRDPNLWLAALLAVFMQAPVVWWNFQHAGATMQYHLFGRWGGGVDFSNIRPSRLRISLASLPYFLWLAPLAAAIFMFWRKAANDTPFQKASRHIAIAAFVFSTLVTCGFSLFVLVPSYWNIAAFPMIYPLVADLIRSRVLILVHFAFGISIASFLLFSFAIVPAGHLMGQRDWENSIVFGWQEIQAEGRALREQYQPDFLAATRYSIAAQLAFVLEEPDSVTDLSTRQSQWDYWSDPAIRPGATALILDVDGTELGSRAELFDRVELLRQLPIYRQGVLVTTYRFWLGTGYRGTRGVVNGD